MDLRRRLLGYYSYTDSQTGAFEGLDAVGLLTSLLLFDECVIHSKALNEVPSLIELFDYRGLMELLKTGAIRFQPVRALVAHIDDEAPDLPVSDNWQAYARLTLDGCLNRFDRHRPAGELENELPVGILVPLESELDGVCELTRVELGVPSRSALRR